VSAHRRPKRSLAKWQGSSHAGMTCSSSRHTLGWGECSAAIPPHWLHPSFHADRVRMSPFMSLLRLQWRPEWVGARCRHASASGSRRTAAARTHGPTQLRLIFGGVSGAESRIEVLSCGCAIPCTPNRTSTIDWAYKDQLALMARTAPCASPVTLGANELDLPAPEDARLGR